MTETIEATRAEVEQQITRLNRTWKAYAQAEKAKNYDLMNLFSRRYARICQLLEGWDYQWQDLEYDKETKMFSLPKV